MPEKSTRSGTEEMLRRYDFIVNTSKDWHTLINSSYVYEAANHAFCLAHEMERDEIIGATVKDIWGAKNFENLIKEKLDQCFKGIEVNYQAWFEMPTSGLQCYDVTYYPYEAEDEKITHAVVVTRNITRRKKDIETKRKLEVELQQARKIEALSTLSGGIAHEFNNALMVVAGNIDLLQMADPQNKAVGKFAKATHESIQRMSNLTQQLLAYAREGDVRLKDVDLSGLIKSILPELKRHMDNDIQIETELMHALPAIKADGNQLRMILTAIMKNANEAIDQGGRIRIMTSYEKVDRDFAKKHIGLTPGTYVCLTIEDDGKGMDKETLRRIFDPFFTTKFQGRGLGMAAVYGVVKNHRGYIYVDSEPGKGTTVRIFMPPLKGKAGKEKICPGDRVTGKPTVLVIDDEEDVLTTIQSLIEKLGYNALGAKSAKEAIELTRTYADTIDLALLDIKLPDMEGGTLYPIIKKARPDMKVIVCSGYSMDHGIKAILTAGAHGYLQKPFSVKIMKNKLKELLKYPS